MFTSLNARSGAILFTAVVAYSSCTISNSRADDWVVSITPRTWYAFQTTNAFIDLGDINAGGVEETRRAAIYPFVGGTLGLGGGWLGTSRLTLTVFDGNTNKASFQSASVDFFDPTLSTVLKGYDEFERFDSELLLQTPISQWTRLFIGGRFIDINGTRTVTEFGNLASGLVTQPFLLSKSDEKDYLLETGLGLSGAITDGRTLFPTTLEVCRRI